MTELMPHLDACPVPHRLLAFVVAFSCALLLTGSPTSAGSAPVDPAGSPAMTDRQRAELIQVLRRQYTAWRLAILRQNLDHWRQVTSVHRRRHLHNEIVSSGGSYPEALFQVIQPPPQMTPLRLVDFRASANVARITMFGPLVSDATSPPDSRVPSDLMHILFHLDEGTWTIDHLSRIALDNRPDWRNRLLRLDYGMMTDPEFSFSGTKPPAPPRCEAPDHVAMLQIFANGYRVDAEINGYTYPPIDNANAHMIVIGGLARGLNDLDLAIEPSDQADAGGHVAVNLWIRSSDPAQESSRVFHFMPRPGQVPRSHRARVEVNEQTLAEGRR